MKTIVLSLVPTVNEKNIESCMNSNRRVCMRENYSYPHKRTRLCVRLWGRDACVLAIEKLAQPRVIYIIRQIARSFPTDCGLAHDEKCCEDRRKSVTANICTRCVIGTTLGLL